jgi:ribosomal protein L7Ae-like RNA K-turn-binding protein
MVKEYFKSLSNTSTTSVESGIFDLDSSSDDEYDLRQEVNIGEKVKEILSEAQNENRLICGWNETIKYLSETEKPEHSLFFILVPSKADDKLSHMSEVFTRAFCLENDIYVIQIDSIDKFNSILGTKSHHSCALIQRSSTMRIEHPDDEIDLDEFSELENDLIDYCEDNWSARIQPIVRLPEK